MYHVTHLIAGLADGTQVFYLNINDALLKTPGTLGKDGIEWMKEKEDWRLWYYDAFDKRPESEKLRQ